MAAGRYMGFDKLKTQLEKRPGVRNPAALAASIGSKKYGKKRMAAAARAGRPVSQRRDNGDTKITEDDPRFNPRTMGNHRGSKNTKTAPGPNGQHRPT